MQALTLHAGDSKPLVVTVSVSTLLVALAARRWLKTMPYMIVSLVAGSAFVALGGASGFWMILGVLFLAGVGSAVQHPLCSAIVSQAYPAAGRRAALGTYNFAGDVGKFAFGGVVSLALMAGIAWQATVVGFGVVAVLTAAAVFVFVGESRPAREHAAPPAQRAGWGIHDTRGFAALCLIEVIDSSTRTGFLTFIAFLLIADGLPAAWAAAAVPLVLIGGMAGKLACGLLAERLGVVRMIVLTELATAGGILAALALPAAAAFVLLPLVGVVLQGTSSVLYATIGEFVDEERLPRAFGLFYTIGSVCGIAAPLGFGLVGDRFGLETTIATIGLGVLLTVPLATLLNRPGGLRLRSS
jgi:MFS family permease